MENFFEEPNLIKGGLAVDERGQVTFVNDFHFEGVKRFYMLENFSKSSVRGFHGHLKEAKYALVVSGTALIVLGHMDNPQNPDKHGKVFRFILSDRNPEILHIPAGYANGVRALENKTKVIFFSTISIEEARNDDFRYPFDYWGEEVWKIKNF
ncbi:MAG: dTDP-4-dehydrorhamnose 3,5-epimerase family protein [Candidatus Pacebacteria bacterium]|nr:dTDP-4-dehydrorhamnose 3,5-epimerase family protein [Candidatus Paceibacterota bacterium]